jgi:hypothetical protein
MAAPSTRAPRLPRPWTKPGSVFGPAPMQGQCLEVANRMAVRFLGEHGPEYVEFGLSEFLGVLGADDPCTATKLA